MQHLLKNFALTIVKWQRTHGRNTLPWQNTQDPYLVWLSEIMLQQTQVSTVLSYYEKFLQRFPTVFDLAAASIDDVLALWSGLGYYSRASNLHRCAQAVVQEFGGQFPRSAQQLQTLPGIGQSTAAAIAAFCFNERVAILDGNVKRVLTRVLAFGGDLAQAASVRQLWSQASDLLPQRAQDMPSYTQGLMDLGASTCAQRQPLCQQCPVQTMCQAHAADQATSYPVRTRKLKRSAQKLWLLWARRADGAVWLERRPTPGVWGGLYCFPVFEQMPELSASLPAALSSKCQEQSAFLHVLTHKDLYLTPVLLNISGKQADQKLTDQGAWFEPAVWGDLGMPAPIRKCLGAQAAIQ